MLKPLITLVALLCAISLSHGFQISLKWTDSARLGLSKIRQSMTVRNKQGTDLKLGSLSVRDFTFEQIPGTYTFDDLGLEAIDAELNNTGDCPNTFVLGDSVNGLPDQPSVVTLPLSEVTVDSQTCQGDGSLAFVLGGALDLDPGFISNLQSQSEILVGVVGQSTTCGSFQLGTSSLLLAVFSDSPISLVQADFSFPANTQILLYVVDDTLECVYVDQQANAVAAPESPLPSQGPVPVPVASLDNITALASPSVTPAEEPSVEETSPSAPSPAASVPSPAAPSPAAPSPAAPSPAAPAPGPSESPPSPSAPAPSPAAQAPMAPSPAAPSPAAATAAPQVPTPPAVVPVPVGKPMPTKKPMQKPMRRPNRPNRRPRRPNRRPRRPNRRPRRVNRRPRRVNRRPRRVNRRPRRVNRRPNRRPRRPNRRRMRRPSPMKQRPRRRNRPMRGRPSNRRGMPRRKRGGKRTYKYRFIFKRRNRRRSNRGRRHGRVTRKRYTFRGWLYKPYKPRSRRRGAKKY